MTQEQDPAKKKRNNTTTGIILIVLGVIGLILRFVVNRDDTEWRTVDIIKVALSVGIIIYGAVTIFRNRRQ